MFGNLFGFMSADMAIDLGTANTLVYVKGRGIVLAEPSVVAIADVRGKKQVLAVGEEAKQMLGRTPGNISAIRPLRDGVIADFEVAEEMIKHFIRKVHNRRGFASPHDHRLRALPAATAVERRAIQESAESAGARQACMLIEEPMAAAIGAGLAGDRALGLAGGGHRRRYDRGRGDLIGRHRVQRAVYGLAATRWTRRSSATFAVNHNLLIGESPRRSGSRWIIGAACPHWAHGDDGPYREVRGRDLMNGVPREVHGEPAGDRREPERTSLAQSSMQ